MTWAQIPCSLIYRCYKHEKLIGLYLNGTERSFEKNKTKKNAAKKEKKETKQTK